MGVTLHVTKKGLWFSRFAFICLLITQSYSLSVSNVTTELSSSCLISLRCWMPFAPISQISDTLHHLVLSLLWNTILAHHWWRFSLYHCYLTSETLWAPPTTILTGSWTAGDSTSRLHLYICFLRPLLVWNAPVEVSQGVDSEMEMRAQALIFMLCLQTLGRLVKIIYISYCQIFIHVAQIH